MDGMVHTFGASGRCWECGETRDEVPIYNTKKAEKKAEKKAAKRAVKYGY